MQTYELRHEGLLMASALVSFLRSGDRPHASKIILLMPGLGGSTKQWASVLGMLDTSSEWQVAVGPSFADSVDENGNSWTVESLADAACQEITALGIVRVVVVAQSVSAVVALEMANRLPKTIVSILLINGGLLSIMNFLDRPVRGLASSPGPCAVAIRLFILLGVPTSARLKKRVASSRFLSGILLRGLVGRESLDRSSDRFLVLMDENKPTIFRALLVNRHYKRRLDATAENVAQRVVLLAGSQDRLATPKDTLKLGAMLSNSEVVMLQQCGHAIPVERPVELVREIQELVLAAS